MKLDLTITVQRPDDSRPHSSVFQPVKLVDVTFARISTAGDDRLIAGYLRALADHIDPEPIEFRVLGGDE